MTRFVLDANILLSAFVGPSESPSVLLFAAIRDRKFDAIGCPEVVVETRKQLRNKPYFRARITENEANKVIAAYTDLAVMLPNPKHVPALLRDPKDDYLVVLAQTAKADAIVTGDKHLLDHAGLQPPAISVRDACEHLGLPLST